MTALSLAPDISEAGAASPATATPGPSLPVQQTHIVRFLDQNIGGEHAALVSYIERLQADLELALKYRARLEAIARAAEVDLA